MKRSAKKVAADNNRKKRGEEDQDEALLKQNDMINAQAMFTYEKHYQRYTRISYLAANSALAYWRELLRINVNP